ncbi:MAG: hypothetical protein ACTMKU_04330, partial [Actinomycetaceae bacterium]
MTVASTTSTAKGPAGDVPVGPGNGLDRECASAIDNVLTIPVALLGRTIGYLTVVVRGDVHPWRCPSVVEESIDAGLHVDRASPAPPGLPQALAGAYP